MLYKLNVKYFKSYKKSPPKNIHSESSNFDFETNEILHFENLLKVI